MALNADSLGLCSAGWPGGMSLAWSAKSNTLEPFMRFLWTALGLNAAACLDEVIETDEEEMEESGELLLPMNAAGECRLPSIASLDDDDWPLGDTLACLSESLLVLLRDELGDADEEKGDDSEVVDGDVDMPPFWIFEVVSSRLLLVKFFCCK